MTSVMSTSATTTSPSDMTAYDDEYDTDMAVLAIQEEQALYRAGVLSWAVQEDLDSIKYWEAEAPRPRDIIYGYRVA
jgi:hypothetical protein